MGEEEDGWREERVGVRLGAALAQEGECPYSDLLFLVGPQKEPLHAHKLILRLSTPLLEQLVNAHQGLGGEGVMEIKLPTTDPTLFKRLLKFIYTDEIDFEDLPSFLQLAKDFGFKGLGSKVISILKKSPLTISNVFLVHEFATTIVTTEDQGVKEKGEELERIALKFILRNAKEILNSSSFLKISHPSLLRILLEDDFALDEVKIFEGVLRWGKSQCQNNALSPSPENLRRVLGGARELIRYCQMDYSEILSTVKPSQIFSSEEFLSVLKNYMDHSHNPLNLATKKRNYIKETKPKKRRRACSPMSLFFGSSKRDSNSFPPHSNLNHGENSLILDHPNRYQEPLNDPLYMNNNNIQFPIPPMDQALVPMEFPPTSLPTPPPHLQSDQFYEGGPMSFQPTTPTSTVTSTKGIEYEAPAWVPGNIQFLNGMFRVFSTSITFSNLLLRVNNASPNFPITKLILQDITLDPYPNGYRAYDKILLPHLQVFKFTQRKDPHCQLPLPDQTFMQGFSSTRQFLFFEKVPNESPLTLTPSNSDDKGLSILIQVRGLRLLDLNHQETRSNLTISFPIGFKVSEMVVKKPKVKIKVEKIETPHSDTENHSIAKNAGIQKNVQNPHIANNITSLTSLCLTKADLSDITIDMKKKFSFSTKSLTKLILQEVTFKDEWSAKEFFNRFPSLLHLSLNIKVLEGSRTTPRSPDANSNMCLNLIGDLMEIRSSLIHLNLEKMHFEKLKKSDIVPFKSLTHLTLSLCSWHPTWADLFPNIFPSLSSLTIRSLGGWRVGCKMLYFLLKMDTLQKISMSKQPQDKGPKGDKPLLSIFSGNLDTFWQLKVVEYLKEECGIEIEKGVPDFILEKNEENVWTYNGNGDYLVFEKMHFKESFSDAFYDDFDTYKLVKV